MSQIDFDAAVSAEAAGDATPGELELLQADKPGWIAALKRLLAETERGLTKVGKLPPAERSMVEADLTEERDRLRAAMERLGVEPPAPRQPPPQRQAPPAQTPAAPVDTGPPRLQASWINGVVVLWAGSPSEPTVSAEVLDKMITEAGASSVGWRTRSRGMPLPNGERAVAVAAPIDVALGWLVAVGAGQVATDAAPSLAWLGEIAVWATELVVQGRMAPTFSRADGEARPAKQKQTRYAVRWVGAPIDGRRLRALASRMPGAVVGAGTPAQPAAVCKSVLNAAVHAICREGASRLVAPAIGPVARTRSEVSEAILAGLDGTAFTASDRAAAEIAHDLGQWAQPVTDPGGVGLIVRLDAPERHGGWLLTVDVSGVEPNPVPVEEALASESRNKVRHVEAQLRRIERLVPALRRPARKRGQVVLSGDEAWDLMTRTGAVLTAAGFDVRLAAVAPRRKAKPKLRMRADAIGKETAVGARQLANVQWSVVFDDVELDAAALRQLAKDARPLVRAKGKWVELDRADIDAAMQALQEKANVNQLTGADILRHAVGLEAGALGGPVVVEGTGWAVDLVRGATEAPPEPADPPKGFKGQLRHYQAEALGWLEFLDRAGLGGCLAMDMGLGKTPTLLAHLLADRERGPSLVVAPLAVLGNWADEAARFTPKLRVVRHYGAERASAGDVAKQAAKADIILTTYGTAVRDTDALKSVDWNYVVVDEAQTIKNPASDTAQELRRIGARSRIALTGTPIENGLGDLWAILDFLNPGLLGPRAPFVEQLSKSNNGGAPGEAALRALNGLLVFRRTKAEPEIASELPDKIDELDHCTLTSEQVGLYQAVLDNLLGVGLADDDPTARKGHVLAAITHLKQICDHPAAYLDGDTKPLDGRSGKLTRLEELIEAVFAAGERMLIFTHFASWGEKMAAHLTKKTGIDIACYHGGLARGTRDRLVHEFQAARGPGALVLSIKAGGAGLNLTAANHVVLYDRWWNPAVEDQARDRAWRIGQRNTVISHRLVCPGTVDERVEEVVAGKRRIADLVLPQRTSLGDLTAEQLRAALGIRPDALVADNATEDERSEGTAA